MFEANNKKIKQYLSEKSGNKPKMLFKDIHEFHAYLTKQSEGALRAVAEMSKRPFSLEQARAQTRRIQQGI